jgi:hypothetical protein
MFVITNALFFMCTILWSGGARTDWYIWNSIINNSLDLKQIILSSISDTTSSANSCKISTWSARGLVCFSTSRREARVSA